MNLEVQACDGPSHVLHNSAKEVMPNACSRSLSTMWAYMICPPSAGMPK